MGSKVCTKCGEDKALDAFGRHKRGRHGRKELCKPCEKAYYAAKTAACAPEGVESKVCKGCGIDKPLTVFDRQRLGKYGRTSKCKECFKAEYPQDPAVHAAYYKANKAKLNAHNIAAYYANKDDRLAKCKTYSERPEVRERNYLLQQSPERKASKSRGDKAWREANPAYCTEASKRKKLAKREATPSWSDPAMRRHIYQAAIEMSEAFGEEFQVDHIVPIKSEFVCGLHCEDNMQLLQAVDNNRKSNLVWPDQWVETWPKVYLGSTL